MTLDWLKSFADADHHITQLHDVFRVDGHVCATNGYLLVATKSDLAAPEFDRTATRDTIEKWLKRKPSGATWDRAELLAQVGAFAPTVTRKCKHCKGTGTVKHRCGCELCEADTEDCFRCEAGIETVTPAERYLRYSGHVFNANALAQVLALCPASETVRLAVVTADLATQLFVWSTTWMAILMPLSDSAMVENVIDLEVPLTVAVPS